MLLAPFEEVEIKDSIWYCDGQKSLSLDGLHFKF